MCLSSSTWVTGARGTKRIDIESRYAQRWELERPRALLAPAGALRGKCRETLRRPKSARSAEKSRPGEAHCPNAI
jgi:hypothetical protein